MVSALRCAWIHSCLRWSFSAFVLGPSHKAELVNFPAW